MATDTQNSPPTIRRAPVVPSIKPCDFCGQLFRPYKGVPWARFCKPQCRDTWHYESRRAGALLFDPQLHSPTLNKQR